MNPFARQTYRPDPAVSQAVIAGMCVAAGIDPRESFTTDEVVSLLRDVGYEVSRGTVHEFERKGWIDAAPDEWDAPAVHQFLAGLEIRRRWQPTPNRFHDLKKSAVRVEVERLIADGSDEPIQGLDKHFVEDLTLQLCLTEDRQVREVLYEVLRQKLAANGWVEE